LPQVLHPGPRTLLSREYQQKKCGKGSELKN
jgi:hypothetical protein